MPYHNSLWNIICFILVQNHVVISRKDDDKFVGFDKTNTTSGYQNYFPHSKESSEKILKGIWLVLGIFLMIALFLFFRFLYKAVAVLCFRHQEKGEYYENEIIFSIWPSGKVIKTEEDCKLLIGSNNTIAPKKKCSFIPHGNYLQHTVVSDLLVYEKIIGLKTGVWPAVKDGIQ